MKAWHIINPIAHTDEYKGKFLVERQERIAIPGISCTGITGCCGRNWSTFFNVTYEIDVDKYRELFKQKYRLNISEWKTHVNAVSEVFLIPKEDILPGCEIGFLNLKSLRKQKLNAFERLASSLIISAEVVNFFIENKLSGWNAYPVYVDGLSGDFFELKANQSNCVVITENPVKIVDQCPVCQYTQYSSEKIIGVECTRESPDFFTVKQPFNGYIFVSERCKDILLGHNFIYYNNFSISERFF